MDSIDFSLEQQNPSDYDYEEAHRHYTMCDSAGVVDYYGAVEFLRGVTPLMKNPQEQHVLTQLLLIAEKYEDILLKPQRADEVLS